MGGVVKKITKIGTKIAKEANPLGNAISSVNKKLFGQDVADKLDWVVDPQVKSMEAVNKKTMETLNPQGPDVQGAAQDAADATQTILGGMGSQSGEDREEEDKVELGRRRRGSGRGAGSGRSSLMADQSRGSSGTGLKV